MRKNEVRQLKPGRVLDMQQRRSRLASPYAWHRTIGRNFVGSGSSSGYEQSALRGVEIAVQLVAFFLAATKFVRIRSPFQVSGGPGGQTNVAASSRHPLLCSELLPNQDWIGLRFPCKVSMRCSQADPVVFENTSMILQNETASMELMAYPLPSTTCNCLPGSEKYSEVSSLSRSGEGSNNLERSSTIHQIKASGCVKIAVNILILGQSGVAFGGLHKTCFPPSPDTKGKVHAITTYSFEVSFTLCKGSELLFTKAVSPIGDYQFEEG
ncbi:uncharacterized protein CLUP02_06570 [Colletotrichum lupini]|uniref:Uncharacterized protein n=1 Tax=Colletotrichum lupini TaxID=145971 RepID=A0A9Q8WF62_9PEZI|nr:uncharacterized protein CLUP02_06570 [Colletotrichum lupini]UQC81084.1 hypothetical protein CLUP02_06570 [Colletotrichum lupini]